MTARILVVDDIPANVKLLEARLLAEYFDVLTAENGFQALDICKSTQVDLVLLDMFMPGMSGIDAIKQIFEIAPETVVIVVSGSDLKELREEVFELGVKIFIVKPFDPLLVAEIVGLLLL